MDNICGKIKLNVENLSKVKLTLHSNEKLSKAFFKERFDEIGIKGFE